MADTARRRAWAVAGLAAAALLAGVGIGNYIFDVAIARVPPRGTMATDDDDDVARTMAAARAEGASWMATTPHRRWAEVASDGVELAGYWFPAEKATARTVVLLHGHRGDASQMGLFAEFYRGEGFNVFMADLRGHGMSGGDYVGMGYLDTQDYLGWLKRIVGTVGPGAEILLHGLSLGAATALMLSGNKDLPPQVKAVVGDCGFSSIKEEVDYRVGRAHLPSFPLVAVASLETRVRAGYWFGDGDVVAAVRQTRRPLLVIHGDADTDNPTWMGRRIFAAAGGPKQLWLVPGAEHCLSFFIARAEYEARLRSFYGRYLPVSTGR